VFLKLFCDLRIFGAKIINVRIFGELLVEEDLVWKSRKVKSTVLIFPTFSLFVLTSYVFKFLDIIFYFSFKSKIFFWGGGGVSHKF
jgi:hypothetical protein